MKALPKYWTMLIAVLMLDGQGPAWAQDFSLSAPPPAPDASTARDGLATSFIELGALGLSRRAPESGRYNGLGDGGSQGLVNFRLALRDPWNSTGTHYFEADGQQIGLANRRIDLRYGAQSDYDLRAFFTTFSRPGLSSFSTPFLGVGTHVLTLPSSWAGQGAGSTANAQNLFRPISLAIERKKGGVTFSTRLPGDFQAVIGFTHERRDGLRAQILSFGADANSAIAAYFPQVIDQTTDRIDASVNHIGQSGQWKISYRGILFSDGSNGDLVQNPFARPAAGFFTPNVGYPTGSGFLSSPPSTSAHQISADGGLRVFDHGRLSAHAAFGIEQQNDPFNAYTANSLLTVPRPLPRASLDGLVITQAARLSLATPLSRAFDFDATINFDHRDNRTPQATYLYIISDSQNQPNPLVPFNSQNARINAPYSWTQEKARAALHYRLSPDTKLSTSYELDIHDRTFQSAKRTQEQTAKMRIAHAFSLGDIALNLQYGQRRVSAYAGNEVFFTTRPSIVTNQFTSDVIVDHPLARKYDLADRTRAKAQLDANIDPIAFAGIGINASLGQDDYARSIYGLRRADNARVDFDIHVRFDAQLKLSGFVSIERVTGHQSSYYLGGATINDPNLIWRDDNSDDTKTIGLKLDWLPPVSGLKISGSFNQTISTTSTRIAAGNISAATTTAPLPDVTSHRQSVHVTGDYTVTKDWHVTGLYQFERLSARDWAYAEGYLNLLGAGLSAPRDHMHIFGASVRHGF
jgi:MtrB/PioB family decaheme-associated outer membrane protein